MKYKHRQSRQVWREVLPFGALLVLWGLMNLWMYLRLEAIEVIPEQVASIWRWNMAIFVVAGVAGAVYLGLRLRWQAARLWDILDAMPCAVLVCDEEKNTEYCNLKAQELINGGELSDVGDRRNWKVVETDICGIRFPGLYTSGDVHLALKEEELPSRRGRFTGSALVLLDVTEWRKNTESTKELAEILHDLNQYLVHASSSFQESMEALAGSTIMQALAFQELADYVYRVANDVELDAWEIKDTLGKITGNIDSRNEEHRSNLIKLNESVQLMDESYAAAKKAASQFETLNKEFGGN